MDTATFKRILGNIEEGVKANFLRDGRIEQVILGWDGNTKMSSFGGLPSERGRLDFILTALKAVFKRLGVVGYIHIIEAKIKSGEGDEIADIIAVAGVTAGFREIRSYRILRRPYPTPPDLVKAPECADFGVSFLNLLGD